MGAAAALGLLALGGFLIFSKMFMQGVEKEAAEAVDLKFQREVENFNPNRNDAGFWKPGTMPGSEPTYDIERVFTNRKGVKITVKLREISETHVLLEGGGKEYSYPIADLSDADQSFLRQVAAGKNPKS